MIFFFLIEKKKKKRDFFGAFVSFCFIGPSETIAHPRFISLVHNSSTADSCCSLKWRWFSLSITLVITTELCTTSTQMDKGKI